MMSKPTPHIPRASGRILEWLSVASTARRRGTLALAAVVVLISVALIPGLQISTSRYGLVADDNPYQARLHRFLEQFGTLDGPLVVVSGADAQGRRRLIDDLVRRLEDSPTFAGRVLARVGPGDLAEVLLLQVPEVVLELEGSLYEDETLAEVVAGGLPGLLELTARRVETQAVALQVQLSTPFTAAFARGPAHKALQNIADAATVLADGLRESGPLLERLPLGKEVPGFDEQGYLAAADGSFHVIALFPELPSDEVAVLAPVIHFIREARDAARAEFGPGAPAARVTGIPTLAVDELSLVKRGLQQSGVATASMILLLFLLAFRSLRQTLLAGIPLVVGLLATLAFARLMYGQLNLITSNFVSLLLGLGIDFAVHALARYNERRRLGESPALAMAQALRRTGPGIVVGAATTALAFLTTTTTEFTAFAELGIITAFGLMAMLLATLLVLPPLVLTTHRAGARVPPEIPGLSRLAPLISSMPQVWVAVGLTAAVVGAFSLAHVGFNARYFDFLPQHTESASALRMLERDPLMNPTFANVTAGSIAEARHMTQRLRESNLVAAVQSPSDLFPTLDPLRRAALETIGKAPALPFDAMASAEVRVDLIGPALQRLLASVERVADALALGTGERPEQGIAAIEALTALHASLDELPDGGNERLAQVQAAVADLARRAWTTASAVGRRGQYDIEDLPPTFLLRFASRDRSALALYVFAADDIWDSAVARRFAAALEEIDPEATGFAITTHRHEDMILRGFVRAALIAAVLVFIMLLLDFRSLADASFAMLPVIFGWFWMLAAMGGMGLPFDVANIVVLPLVLGIGVDAGVHMVHRTRESAAEAGGVARVHDVLTGTGGAVALASVTTMAGFAGLMVADYGGMKSLGLLMILGVGACMLASLIILPAVLVLARRAR